MPLGTLAAERATKGRTAWWWLALFFERLAAIQHPLAFVPAGGTAAACLSAGYPSARRRSVALPMAGVNTPHSSLAAFVQWVAAGRDLSSDGGAGYTLAAAAGDGKTAALAARTLVEVVVVVVVVVVEVTTTAGNVGAAAAGFGGGGSDSDGGDSDTLLRLRGGGELAAAEADAGAAALADSGASGVRALPVCHVSTLPMPEACVLRRLRLTAREKGANISPCGRAGFLGRHG